MNEKKVELVLSDLSQSALKTSTNTVDKSQPEYQSVFTKNLPKKTKQALMCVFISVGKAHCEGAQLQSLLKLLNKTFTDSHVLFVIADSLQRFTYQSHGINEQDAEQKAIQAGIEWKEQHVPMIQNTLSNITYDFVHWIQLTSQNESYGSYAEIVDIAYKEDEIFRRKFDKTVTGFLSAQLGDKNIEYVVDNYLGTQLCLAYLKEECSAHLVLANQKCSAIKPFPDKDDCKIDYAVYPRSMSDAFEATYQKFISTDVLIYLSVRNKPVKPEGLLHIASGRKPEIADCPKTYFFKQPNTKQSETLPTLTELSNTMVLKAYFSCFKVLLDSKNISPETKLELIEKIIKEGEKILGEKPYNQLLTSTLNI